MATLILLVISAVLQVIAAVVTLFMLRVAKVRLAWVMIAAAYVFMAAHRIVEALEYTSFNEDVYTRWGSWIGLLISILMLASVILINNTLRYYKKVEAEKDESEKRFSTLFHNSSDEIYLADLDGNFLEVNQVVCDALGYTAEELRKLNFSDLKTPKYAAKVEENKQKILSQGKLTYETEHVSREGKTISLEMKSRLIDYQGTKAILSIARDITERKQMERHILRAVINAEERERERISREIHDGLGPLLSTIKLYVNEVDSNDNTEDEVEALLKRSNELIDEAISSTRTISNTLTPRVIKDYGLIRAIDAFVKKLNLSNKLNVVYDPSGIKEIFDPTLELVLYRVVTELMSNTLKHAQAKKIEIHLEKLDNRLQLTYMDDGIGFDKEKVLDKNNSGGMGLQNVISRLRSVNGSYQIHSSPKIGTMVIVEVGLEQKTNH